jgi:uncharacterized protein (TIGR03067 family)
MFLAILTLTSVCLDVDDPQESAKKELAKLEGTWRLVGAEEVGHVIGREDAKKEQEELIFKGDTLTQRNRGNVIQDFKVSIDPSKNPKEMTLRFSKGSYEGKMCLAIYALEGDQLKICTETKLRPSRGGPRPNVFSTQKTQEPSKHPGVLLFILERQK